MKTKLLLSFITLFLINQIFAQELDSFKGKEIPITQGTTLGDLPIFNSKGFNTIYWYDAANQEEGIKLAASTEPNNNDVSYAYQTIGSCAKSLAVKTVLLDVIPPPTGDMPIVLCGGDTVTLCDLPIFNTEGFDEIYWFSTPNQTEGTLLGCDTLIDGMTTYYAFQGIGGEAEALEVSFVIADPAPAPIYDGEMPIVVCEGDDITLGELPVYNTPEFTYIFWYNSLVPEATPLDLDTVVEEGIIYYAFQVTGSCNYSLEVTVEINPSIPAPYPHPYSGMPIIQCEDDYGSTLSDLPIHNTDGYDSVFWFSTINQEEGTELEPITEIVEGVIYYAFQAIDYSSDCVEALEVTVQLENSIPPVTGESNQYFCVSDNPTVADLIAYNTEGYDYILWYPICCPISEDEALDPSILLVDGVDYYAHQGISTYCSYGIFSTTVHLISIPAPNGETVQTYCCEDGTTFDDIAVFNNGEYDTIYWFTTDDNSGTPIEMDSEIEFDNYYYAFQSLDECALSLEVALECVPHTPAPLGESTQYFENCDGITLADLAVFNTDGYGDISWSLNPAGYPLVPETTIVENGNTYYAFQEWEYDHCCEPLAVTVSCNIGVADSVVSFFTISPNPTQDFINISFTEILSNPTIIIVDALGKTVMNSKLVYENKKAIVDLSSYQAGVYFVQIKEENKSQTQRIVKK